MTAVNIGLTFVILNHNGGSSIEGIWAFIDCSISSVRANKGKFYDSAIVSD